MGKFRITALLVALGAIMWLAIPARAAGLTTERVSVSSTGEQGNDASDPEFHSISADGRFVSFDSLATNMVPGDSNGRFDVFRRDRSTGQTIRASVSSTGEQGNDDSFDAALSDGNQVAFDSFASNLVPKDTNRNLDTFVHDVAAGTTTRVSVASDGKQGQGDSFGPAISDDDRLVLFSSEASLVPSDTNRRVDVYTHDLSTGQTSLVSVSPDGQPGNDDSFSDSIAGDGRFVTFISFADNLVPGDTNGALDVFMRDRATGQTTLVSVSSTGQKANEDSFQSVVTPDGRFVAFTSFADNLVRNDRNSHADLFVRDLKTGKTTLVSKSSTGEQGNDDSASSKGISADGRFVAYRSSASNLVPDDTNAATDVFLTDRSTGQTIRASLSVFGAQGDGDSFNAAISENGAWVSFGSLATNLVSNDTNGTDDSFVRGPFGASSFQTAAATVSGKGAGSASTSSGGRSACRAPAALKRYLSRLPAAARAGCAM